MSNVIIPEGYEEYPEDRVQRLHTKPTGGREMKLSGTIRCPKTDCGRTVPFQLRTHDASKVEFKTTCKRCSTRIDLTFFVAEAGVNETPYEMIEKAQPSGGEPSAASTPYAAGKYEDTQGEENAAEQLPTPADIESGQPNEDSNEPSGDEQDKAKLLNEKEDWPTKTDPFAGLE